MSHTTVGILRGGPSSEYDVSLRTGHRVRQNMGEQYAVKDIFVDKAGLWHVDGIAKNPAEALRGIDVVFNAMHGQYGEDGKVQHILDTFNTPYTGSKRFASMLAMDKIKTKELLQMHGVKTPAFTYVKKDEYTSGDLAEIYGSMRRPLVIKPNTSGSSVATSLVHTFADFVTAVDDVFAVAPIALIEEYIQGTEVTCGVLDHSNGTDIYTFYPVEISHTGGGIWDYTSKYSDELHTCFCPARIGGKEKRHIQETSHLAHSVLDLSHYSRSDFMIADNGEVYFLETNTLPGLTETSLYPIGLESVGLTMTKFIDHVLTLAIKKK